MKRPVLQLYCDGSGTEKVGGPGGWAFVGVVEDVIVISGQGAVAKTTCLVMELEAARAALAAALTHDFHISHALLLLTDSKIALDVATQCFKPKPTKYHAQCDALIHVAKESKCTFKWIKGHSGNPWNDLVDLWASEAKRGIRK